MGVAHDTSAAGYRLDTENPWPGLAWFGESAAPFFNGRRREVAELKRLVVDEPLTVLFGRSGLGKTSLLKAGLFPALRQRHFLPVYLRIAWTAPPGQEPTAWVEQLFAAFVRACEEAGADAPTRRTAESLWEYLHRPDFKVWSAQQMPLVPVFVIDQFEEVFTLGAAHAAAVSRLREDLADLAENRIPVATEQRLTSTAPASGSLSLRAQPYRVLLSFREDFATAFERWHELPALMRNRLQLLPMTGTQAFEAVYRPASHLMDEDTAEQIVRFVASERRTGAGGDGDARPLEELSVEPALLSLVCRGLNDARHRRRDRGGLNRIDRDLLASTGPGVVDRHYDTCMDGQPEKVHRFVESELVTESGFRKPCAQDDALRDPYGLALDSLRILVDRRLLRIEPSLGVTRVELIHDLLAPTVVARRDARRRLDQERTLADELRQQAEARRAAEAERRAKRRLRVAAAVAAVALAVAGAVGMLAYYAWQQRTAAEAQARVAKSRELALAAITRLDLDPELAVRLAMHAASVAPTDQAESALRQALFRWRARATPATPVPVGATGTVHELVGHSDDVMSVAFSPDGTRLLSAGCDQTARLWDAATGAEIRVLRDHHAPLAVGAFSRDGRLIGTAGGHPCITHPTQGDDNDTDVRIWEAASTTPPRRLAGALTLLVGATFSADGTEFAAGGTSGEVLVWTLSTGLMRVLGPQSATAVATIQSMEFSPNGRQLATAGLDGSVVIWRPGTGERLATLRHDEPVLALAYGGGDGRDPSLASVDASGIARLWDPDTYELRREIRSYSAPLNTTAFSRDGRFLVTAGKDLSVWEADTGARMQLIADHGNLYAAAISADGRRIAVGGRGGFLALLDCDVCVPMDQLVRRAAEGPPRELTPQERKDFLGADR